MIITMQPTMKGRLIHHYRIESLLGEGGMGTVYQAVDTHLERLVAVKMLHPHLVSQVSFMERFRNEALILARLNHPNIAVVYNFLQDGADYFMAMEYVEGDSLERLIRQAGAIPSAVAAEMTRQGLEGLAHAHRKGVLHRDIKPANLMLTPEGTIKLMDFGIARVVGNQRMTQVNRLVGTLEYMAPELIKGEAPSVASDIYAMGILLYELLSGKLPFASQTDYELMQAIVRDKPAPLRKLNGQVSKELEAIVQKALDKNPAKRFTDVKEFQRSLQPFAAQAPVLDLAQLSRPAQSTDILAFQPVRQTVLADTRVATAGSSPAPKPRWRDWITENWQTLLAGGLTLVALVFIGLIFLDRSADKPAVVSKPKGVIKPPGIKQRQVNPVDSPATALAEPRETRTPSFEPRQQPVDQPAAPVDKEPGLPKTTEKPAAPPKTEPRNPTVRKEAKPAGPTARLKAPESTVVAVPPPSHAEPEKPPVHIPVSVHKTVSISRLRVNLALLESLSSDQVQEGQSIRFRVTEPVVIDGNVVIATGATAYGVVSRVKQADGDMFRKKNLLEFRIQTVDAVNGKRIGLRSSTISDEAKGQPVLFRSGQTFEVRTSDDLITL